jgi:Mn-dependent DtxR family transcriptional regulator
MPRGAKPKVYPEKTVIAVRRLYENGATQHEIASKLGLTQKIIFNVMRRHGIEARVAAKRDQWGPNNHAWKGDGASNYAFHRRLYSRYGKPSKCRVCGTEDAKHYDYANLTGRYEDLDDYAPMCRSCHWKYDDKVSNITKAKGGMSNAQA